MNVYNVRFDGEYRVVEAGSFADAVHAWRADLLAEWKEDGCYKAETDDGIDPEAVELISELPVLRPTLDKEEQS